MSFPDLLSSSLFLFLLGSNCLWALFYRHRLLTLREEHAKHLQQELAKRPPSQELDEFLHDLTAFGAGVVRISPISVKDIILRARNNEK